MTATQDRRSFLAAATGSLLSLPALSYNNAFGKDAVKPSGRVRVGAIGVGGQGRNNMKRLIQNVVAVCDVDAGHLARAADMVKKRNGGHVHAHKDYRRLLDDKSIDAVVVSTPDHWHALPTIHACRAGKDVYCEKPLTLFIDEGRAMVEAAREHKRVVQTGSQQRSSANFRKACELVRNGVIGKVHTVRVGISGVNFKGPPVPNSDAPAALDYDFWLGPAPEVPYNRKHVHYNFRFFWDYSGGQMTNWGAHHLDIAQWGLGMDESGPVRAEGTAVFHPKKWYEVPMTFEVTYEYADGVKLLCGSKQPRGTTFVGEKGTIFVNRGKLRATPAEVLETDLPDSAERLHVSRSHHKNWLDCIQSREKPICDVEIGHRSASVCHLGNMAILAGRPLRWDPKAERVVGDEKADAMTRRPYRSPWKLA